jgi:hypothetical protein
MRTGMTLVAVALAGMQSTVVLGSAYGVGDENSPNPSPGGPPGPSPQPGAYAGGHHPAPPPSPSPQSTTSGPKTTTTPAKIYGCTDSTACNLNTAATVANKTACVYAAKNSDCSGVCLKTAPADCKGICGGSSVCTNTTKPSTDCPATCKFLDAKGIGETCDDVGMTLAKGSTSCAALEASGCDCTGCTCGIIDDGYEIFNQMEATGATCDKGTKIAQPCTAAKTCTSSECVQQCTLTTGCNYAGWNTQGGCILYSSCKSTLTAAAITTTFERQADAAAECTCTWWTCVNDGGKGYC